VEFCLRPLKINVKAKDGAGYNCDVSVIIKPDWGAYYYNNGSTFQIGLAAYYTGPMMDIRDSVYNDSALPRGKYMAYVLIDKSANGLPTPSKIIAQDQCNIEVKDLTGWNEDFEDGVADDFVIGPSPGCNCWYVGPTTNLTGLSYYFENLLDPCYDWHSSINMKDQYADFTYEATMSRLSGSHHYHYGMIMRNDGVGARSNGYVCYLKASLSRFSFDVYTSGVQTTLASSNPFFTNADVVKVVANGPSFNCYFNGNLEFTVSDPVHPTGYVGLMGQGSATLDNIFEYDDVSLIP